MKFTPKTRGFVSLEEMSMIREALELDQRNDIELSNIQDMVGLVYDIWIGDARDADNQDMVTGYMDAKSAVLFTITREKFDRSVLEI
jgi:hypothetical protein